MVIGSFNICRFHVFHCSMSVSLLTMNACFFLFVYCLLHLCIGEAYPGSNTRFCKLLNICYLNIRSLSQAKFLAPIIDMNDIITLSETHLHPGVTNDVFDLPGYHEIIRNDRNGQGGGVAVFVKQNITYKRIYELEKPNVEAIWLQLSTLQGKILICCCYRPPNDNNFWDNFDTVIEDAKGRITKYMFILGDINADFATINGRKLDDMCLHHNLHCMVREPTRITETTSTVLDQVITNAPNFVSNISVSPPVSTNDHCTVSAQINFKLCREKPYVRNI